MNLSSLRITQSISLQSIRFQYSPLYRSAMPSRWGCNHDYSWWLAVLSESFTRCCLGFRSRLAPGLVPKLKSILPTTYFLILPSFLSWRFLMRFLVIPTLLLSQSILGPILYAIFSPILILFFTYADDSAVLCAHKDSSLPIASFNSIQNPSSLG